MSKDSMRAAKKAAEEAEKKDCKSEKTESKEAVKDGEKVVVELDKTDSGKLANSLRLIAEKIDKQDESLKKNLSEIDELKKRVDSFETYPSEIEALKKRVDSFETSTEKCQNDDLNSKITSYIDRRISEKFEEAKTSLDEMFDAKMKAFVGSLPKKAEESKRPTTTPTQSPWRTVRQKIGEISESIKYYDGRSLNNVVGEVIEERVYY